MMDYTISILTRYHAIHNAYITMRIDSMHRNYVPRSSNDHIKRFVTPREIARSSLHAANNFNSKRDPLNLGIYTIENIQFVISSINNNLQLSLYQKVKSSLKKETDQLPPSLSLSNIKYQSFSYKNSSLI